jgi:hypothetical protein
LQKAYRGFRIERAQIDLIQQHAIDVGIHLHPLFSPPHLVHILPPSGPSSIHSTNAHGTQSRAVLRSAKQCFFPENNCPTD